METSPDLAQQGIVDAVEGPGLSASPDNDESVNATRHEDEAKAALLHAMKREHDTNLRKTEFNLNINLGTVDPEERQSNAAKREEPSLAETANYLMTLHGGGTLHSTEEDKGMKSLSDAGATDRIVQTASLFKAAATVGKKSTKDQENDSSPSPATGSQDGETAAGEDGSQARQEDLGSNNSNSRHTAQSLPSKAKKALKGVSTTLEQEWASIKDFYEPKREDISATVIFWSLTTMLPSLGIAFILFYGVDNPPTGYCDDPDLTDDGNPCRSGKASASWWILFIGCRHVIIYLLARISDVFFVDFLILQHPWIVRLLGPRMTLIIVQFKGWPSLLWSWGVWTSLLLYGDNPFANHWLHFQNGLDIFSDRNPSGDVTSARFYGGLVLIAYCVPLCVALKRHFLGLHMGARLYARYNDRLQEVIRRVLLIAELSLWVRLKRDQKATYGHFQRGESSESLYFRANDNHHKDANPQADDETLRHTSTDMGDGMDYLEILDPWTEPERGNGQEQVSGKHIIEFQHARAILTRPFFFSSAFGPVDSRNECTRSSELLFLRILKIMESNTESIDIGDLTDWMFQGCTTEEQGEKAQELGDLLCPDKDGQIYIIDFIGAIDEVYKSLRMLEHAISNTSHIDQSYEALVNIVFYFTVGVVSIHILGLNPWSIIIPIGAFIFSLAFMIGDAASQIFEGVVLVLIRQPFDVGDKIAIAAADDPASLEGSAHWLVMHVDLLKTVAKLVGTNEVASFSNGSLARSRLLNMNRSPDALVYVYVRFGMGVPYASIMLLKTAVERFVEARPKEWIGMVGFRTNRVEVEKNFTEYIVVLKHQNTWQNLIPIKESKALVAAFCVEAQKKLGCDYQDPPMNIEISVAENHQDPSDKAGDKVEEEFQQVTEDSIKDLLQFAQTFGTSPEEEGQK